MEYTLSLPLIVCLLCCWVAYTSQGSCKITTEDDVTFTTDIEYNGVTYYDYQISISNTKRGYQCKQGSSKCKGMHMKAQGFYSSVQNANNDIKVPQSYSKRMCRPDTTNTVTQTVDVTLGGTPTQVTVEWSNITKCTCQFPWDCQIFIAIIFSCVCIYNYINIVCSQ